eukprot:5727968-Alexandrium_andersonii.AAC.1
MRSSVLHASSGNHGEPQRRTDSRPRNRDERRCLRRPGGALREGILATPQKCLGGHGQGV